RRLQRQPWRVCARGIAVWRTWATTADDPLIGLVLALSLTVAPVSAQAQQKGKWALGTEIVQPSHLEQLCGNRGWAILIATDVQAALDQISWLARAHPSLLARIPPEDQLDQLPIMGHAPPVRVGSENQLVGLWAGRLGTQP